MKKTTLFLGLIFSLSLVAQTARTKIDKYQIQIGDSATLTIETFTDKNTKVRFPLLKDSLSKNLEILKIKYDSAVKQDQIIRTQKIYFTSFQAGKHSIMPLVVRVGKDAFMSQIFQIEVTEPNVPDNAEIRPMKDIYRSPLSFWDKVLQFISQPWVYLIILFIVFAILIFLVIMILKSRKTKNIQPQKTIYQIALQKINELQEKQLMQQNQAKKHYSELVVILKELMSNHYHFSAFQLISSDVIYYLKAKRFLKPELEKDLLEIFNAADLAKFAKSQPSLSDSENHLQLAKNFVETVTPKTDNYVSRN